MTLRIRLLGEVAVESDGRRLALPGSGKATALLVWLALNPGQHPRARVAPLLWPDVLDESARASLRTAVWALRGALAGGADALVASRTAIGLRDGVVEVDVLELRRLASEGRLADAAALAHAELAPGVDEDWLEEARDEHRVLLGDIFEQLARTAEEDGDAAEAAVWSRRRVWLDPLDEETQQALLRRLAALGDRAGALHSFARFRTRLRADLGLVPSPETLALVAAIRATTLGTPELPARLSVAVGETIVGRERELERLLACFADVGGAPLPVVVVVAAEPGVGKTRLVGELAQRVQAEGHRVVYGAAGPDAILPYQPVVEALSEGVGATLDELIADAGGEEGGANRYRLFERIAGLVGGLAESSPALVALDDLHWADLSTMQLLRHVARSHRARGAMLLLAYRPSELGAPLADLLMDLNRDRPLERIALEGLTEPDIAALLRAWGADDAEAKVQALHDRTDGNPFFLREVMRDIAEGGDPRDSVPHTVRDVVRARLARLDAPAQALAAAGAVAGPAFDPVSANAALAEPLLERELAPIVDGLVGSGLVNDSDAGGRLRFEHMLVRDAVYGDLGSARRAALHRALADGLIDRHGADPGPHLAEIAHHLRAGGAARAVEWTIAAADYAFDHLAFDQAGRLYAAALAGLTPGDERRGAIAKRRAMASQLLFHSMFDQAPRGRL